MPITEEHPLQAQSPYSASKIAADKLAESYHLSFDLPVVTVRPFNTYGPRQSARAVIPTVIIADRRRRAADLARVRSSRPATSTSSPTPPTAFVSVVRADAADVVGRVFNAGPGHEISIGDLVGLHRRA